MKKKCYECNGTGKIGSCNNVICYECKGKGYIKSMNKLRKIIEDMFIEDDRGRDKVRYDLGKTIEKGMKRIRRLRLKDIEGE